MRICGRVSCFCLCYDGSRNAFVESHLIISGPANNILSVLRCTSRMSDCSTIVEVGRFAAIRSDVANHIPTTNLVVFAEVSLLQLHVVYGGIIDLLWCLFNAIAFSLKKNVYSC